MTSETHKESAGIFYGWRIVAISTFALLVSNGLAIGGIPVFYKPMLDDLIAAGMVTKESAPQILGVGPALTFFLSGLSSPIAGALLERYSAKVLMRFGSVLLGAGILIYAQARAPSTIYVAHSMFGASLGFVGVLANSVLISRWFRRRRGAAMGVVLTGTSWGGFLIPIIGANLMKFYTWRASLALVSLLVWLVLLPAILFVVRERPEDLGLAPDGDEANESVAEKMRASVDLKTRDDAAQVSGASLGEALRDLRFWILSLTAALVFYVFLPVSQQLVKLLQTPRVGMTNERAGYALSVLAVAALSGKFLFGWLSDRLSKRFVAIVCCALMTLGAMLLPEAEASNAYLLVALFGAGYGGAFTLIQLLVAEVFGLREIGKILGAIFVIETAGGALGNLITGEIAAAHAGDYQTAFRYASIAAALALVSTLALFLLSRSRRDARKNATSF